MYYMMERLLQSCFPSRNSRPDSELLCATDGIRSMQMVVFKVAVGTAWMLPQWVLGVASHQGCLLCRTTVPLVLQQWNKVLCVVEKILSGWKNKQKQDWYILLQLISKQILEQSGFSYAPGKVSAEVKKSARFQWWNADFRRCGRHL